MSDTMTPPPQDKMGRFDRAARWIGDLDHPFYDDERQRWVWYEASAIATQMMLVGTYLAATIVLLVYGADTLTPVLIMMAPVIAATTVLLAYTVRHAAEYAPNADDFRRGRGRVVGAVLALFAATWIWTAFDGDWGWETLLGAGFGVGVVVGIAASINSGRTTAGDSG